MKKLLSASLIIASLIILSGPKVSYADGWRRGSGFNEGDLNIDKNSIDFAEKDATPSTPGTNRGKLYVKDNGSGTTKLYFLDSTPTETDILTGTSGAPISSTFITVSSDATLTAERTLTEGLALDLSDGGANSTITIAFDPTELTGNRTWAAGGAGTVAWTFDTTGTDQVLTADGTGFLSVSGDFKVLGDDLFMATNTSGAALIADGTNFNPVVISGDVVIGTDGTATIQANSVALGTDTVNAYVADLTAGTAIDVSGGGAETANITVDFDSTEVEATTWGAGGNASNIWTFNLSGTDPTLTAGSGMFSVSHDFTISGDDLFMATNTDRFVLIADGTNFNPEALDLGTDTTGNYVASVTTSAVTGLTGGAAGSEGAALTLAWDYTSTVAGNPGLASGAIVAGTTGLVFEGTTADSIEGVLEAPTLTGVDRSWTLPNVSGTIVTTGDTGSVSGDMILNDSVALTTDTTGNYVKDVADGTGIDGTASAEGATYTPTLDLTEISSTTWGAGAFTTMTFDAGATDPVFTFGSNSFAITSAAVDLGGTTSFEVPNGAGGTTVDATGEVTIDSTSKTLNFYDGAAEVVLQPIYSKNVTIENPTSSEDFSVFFTDEAVTVTKMVAVLVGSSTPSVTWTVRHGTDRSAAGAEVVTGGTATTSISTGSVVTSFNDATVVADSFLWLETTAQSGTVNSINVTIFYTQDP